MSKRDKIIEHLIAGGFTMEEIEEVIPARTTKNRSDENTKLGKLLDKQGWITMKSARESKIYPKETSHASKQAFHRFKNKNNLILNNDKQYVRPDETITYLDGKLEGSPLEIYFKEDAPSHVLTSKVWQGTVKPYLKSKGYRRHSDQPQFAVRRVGK